MSDVEQATEEEVFGRPASLEDSISSSRSNLTFESEALESCQDPKREVIEGGAQSINSLIQPYGRRVTVIDLSDPLTQ